jgi:hypothetical protein
MSRLYNHIEGHRAVLHTEHPHLVDALNKAMARHGNEPVIVAYEVGHEAIMPYATYRTRIIARREARKVLPKSILREALAENRTNARQGKGVERDYAKRAVTVLDKLSKAR